MGARSQTATEDAFAPRGTAPDPDPDRHAISLGSSKVALAKALGDPLRHDPGRLESPMIWPEGPCGPWRAIELPAPEGPVAWICWQAPLLDPAPVSATFYTMTLLRVQRYTSS